MKKAQATPAVIAISAITVIGMLVLLGAFVSFQLQITQNEITGNFTVDEIVFDVKAPENYTLTGAGLEKITTEYRTDGVFVKHYWSFNGLKEVNAYFNTCTRETLSTWEKISIDFDYKSYSSYSRGRINTDFSWPTDSEKCTGEDISCDLNNRILLTATREETSGLYRITDGLRTTVLDSGDHLCFQGRAQSYNSPATAQTSITINSITTTIATEPPTCTTTNTCTQTTDDSEQLGFWNWLFSKLKDIWEWLTFWRD